MKEIFCPPAGHRAKTLGCLAHVPTHGNKPGGEGWALFQAACYFWSRRRWASITEIRWATDIPEKDRTSGIFRIVEIPCAKTPSIRRLSATLCRSSNSYRGRGSLDSWQTRQMSGHPTEM